MRSRSFPAGNGEKSASTSEADHSRSGGASLLVFAAALVLSGCGGGPANVLDPPSFITGALPAPGTATYEPVRGETEAGEYAFPWHLYDDEDDPECHQRYDDPPNPPPTCPPIRIGIEDTPVDFTNPAFHGRVVLEGATFAYWRPLAGQAAQNAFAACTEEAPCRVFHMDSNGDSALREDRARAVLEHMGLPEGNNRWFLYDRAQGDRGWYELPGVEDYFHGSLVASVALGGRFHPFPFPDPVIVPMARNFDPREQREDQHYFSDWLAEMRRVPEGVVGFDSANFPFRFPLSNFVHDTVELDPEVPEFLTDAADDAVCHPLLRLAPGLVCSPWASDGSLYALASSDGTGAWWRFSEGVSLSAFTRYRGRLDGAASGAFSFEGGSSLAALRLDRKWFLDETGRWRMEGAFTLAADLSRGLGERRTSLIEAGPALLSDWIIGVTHSDSRDLHTRLSLSQPPRAETGRGLLTLPSGRLEDGTRTYETHRFSLVPSRRQITLRLAHQRPLAGGDVVFSVHRTKNQGHFRVPSRVVAGVAWRRSF